MAPPRRTPRPAVLPLIATGLAAACAAAGRAPADEKAAPPPAPEQAAARPAREHRPPADVVRLFRFHAAAEADALRDAVERARLDETRRDELRLLVREHHRRVEDELTRVTAAMPLDDVLARAEDLARDLNDRQVAAWLDEHPAAYQPVQEQIALAEAYGQSVAEEPDAVVRAARAAGLPPEREAALRRLVTDTHERLRTAGEADARRLREAGDRAAAPPPAGAATPDPRSTGPAPAPPPSASRPLQRPGVSPPPARHAPASPPPAAPPDAAGPGSGAAPPPSPEAERLQLLDALAFIDAQARVAAAARDVRTEVEKLLPQPPQRKALEDEMLRWYQAHAAPPEDAPGEGAPGDDAAPQGATPDNPAPGRAAPDGAAPQRAAPGRAAPAPGVGTRNRPAPAAGPRPSPNPRPRTPTRSAPIDPGF